MRKKVRMLENKINSAFCWKNKKTNNFNNHPPKCAAKTTIYKAS